MRPMKVRTQQFAGGAGCLFGSFTIVRHEAKLIEAQLLAAKFFCLSQEANFSVGRAVAETFCPG